MKVSRTWLQNYFDAPLPEGQELSDAFTFHSFEVDEEAGDMLDLKVLPDRSGYGLCHRGIAYELSAALSLPMKQDPLRAPLPNYQTSKALTITVANEQKCSRYMGAVVTGVKVGPSPTWLQEALVSIGQRSINNVVDATNYVMLNVGQPLHAFDADKLQQRDGTWKIGVRDAREGEKITTLTGDEYELTTEDLLIVDGVNDVPIGVAGVKGGKVAEVDVNTTTLIIEAANFDGPSVRRTAQRQKLFTDASLRFQNRPSAELVAYGIRDVLALIADIAGGEVEGVVDYYPTRATTKSVSVTLSEINGRLGSQFTEEEVESVWKKLGFTISKVSEGWEVTPPFERTDIIISEDLAEEVGRILGYDRLTPTPLPSFASEPDQTRFRGIEYVKDQLVDAGCNEVSTQSFAKKGDVILANPLDATKPALRTKLEENLREALAVAKHYAPLTLKPNEKPRLFEVGSVFPKNGESTELYSTESVVDAPNGSLSLEQLEAYGKTYEPKRYTLSQFKPFSQYPFVARDIALWVEDGVTAHEVAEILDEHAGELRVRTTLFDEFKKEGRTSYAFRLVFQSNEQTLTDSDVNVIMDSVYSAVQKKGWEVR